MITALTVTIVWLAVAALLAVAAEVRAAMRNLDDQYRRLCGGTR